MAKDILCAVDFSESSLDALLWTFELAKKNGANVSVMFCYRLISEADDEETLNLKKKIEENARHKFREFERDHLIGHQVSYRFITEVGFYHFRIETFLRDHPVGLLVMGSSLIKNFNEYNCGFEKFLKNSKVAVVIVPEESAQDMKNETARQQVISRS